jgi:hypothetical protein
MNPANSGPQQRTFLPPPPPMVLPPIPMWKWIAGVLAVLACVAGLAVFAKWTRVRSHKATVAVIALHRKMARADDAGIFADADPSYQEMVTAQISNSMFDNVRTQLGAPRSSIPTHRDESTYEGRGTFMTLHYRTVFDKGPGDETICLHNVDGVWKLAAYNVESPLLRSNKPPVRLQLKPSH